MKIYSLLKVNLALGGLAFFAHIGAIDGVSSEFVVFLWALIIFDLSFIGSAALGLWKSALQWSVLAYQAAVLVFGSLYIAFILAEIAFSDTIKYEFSIGLGLPTLLCIYTAYLFGKVINNYMHIDLKYLHWIVGVAMVVLEITAFQNFKDIMFN